MDTAVRHTDGPPTLVVGGASRRAVVSVLVAAAIGTGAVAWISNVEPLRVDTTAIGIRPIAMVADSLDATSPQGDSFTQYTIPIRRGDSFAFSFWLHNDAPYPVAVTGVAAQDGWSRGIVDVRIGPASGSEPPPGTLPYTIPAGEYAALEVRYRLHGCIEEGAGLSFGTLPVAFRLFGLVPRSTTITMPMTIELTGPPGTTCPA